MQTYLELAEFCTLVHLNEDVVKGMMANGALNFKEEDGKIYIEANQGTFSVVPSSSAEAVPISSIQLAGENFVEKTLGAFLNLHEKVLDAKDETLDALKNENKFLKDALYSMQEIYDNDRKTIDILNAQLARATEEIEFLKRKYKLMWNKAVDNFTSQSADSVGLDKNLSEKSASVNLTQDANASLRVDFEKNTTHSKNAQQNADNEKLAKNLGENLANEKNKTENLANEKIENLAENSSENSTPNSSQNSAQIPQSTPNLNQKSENSAINSNQNLTPNLNTNSTAKIEIPTQSAK